MADAQELQPRSWEPASKPLPPQKSSFPSGVSSSVAREMSLAWKLVAGRGGGLAQVPGANSSSSCHSQPLVIPAQGEWGEGPLSWWGGATGQGVISHSSSGSSPARVRRTVSGRWASKAMGVNLCPHAPALGLPYI